MPAPVKPDYTQPWVRGWEHISQEGTTFWERLRTERGLSREDVWEMSDGMITPARLAEIEGDYSIGTVYDLDDLITLAIVYDEKPGELLDRSFEEKGRELLEEENG